MSKALAQIAPGVLMAGHFKFHSTGLEIIGHPSFEEWSKFGQGLQFIHSAVHWLLGDWILWGEHEYGEMYAQALKLAPFKLQTLQNDVWVCRRFPKSSRHSELTFNHHSVVAALPPAEQDAWLDMAEREGWSSRQLWAESRDVPEKLVPLYDGLALLANLHGRRGPLWTVELPAGTELEARAGDSVHIVLKEAP